MEDPTSTVPLNVSISQEVLHPEEYDLIAKISQFSEFQDNWEDLADEFRIQLNNQDDDGLLDDDRLLEDNSNSEDNGEDDGENNGEDDSEDNDEDNGEDNSKVPISFALPSLTGYPRKLSKSDVLRELNSL